ncbi:MULTISPECIES: Bug family tripartite tricarboxylate transporter substrate binding protein [Bordetella]|uniref:Twin-arginine translocation pathway signal protein n=1 Tax=Bordetella genomosp. 6 TaxID=463024 RepID=A0ABX4FDZ4_9BORD|nr:MULTISPECIES: tripartite tricarboxylate transporter substrate binding protein [Bordetella]AOB29367.1 twin-arginine translocation pathway signal protein [Bordetella bronchiseptica]AZW46652.1 tripartite tricarboxylate transporter substrate binding protein [Bordetella bronchiseptica]KCV59025.1 tripartite tricarboxylate transporter family receptor [Bordetella bronchiseptica 99-R-0433]MBN3267025.1 tripartite tricarboxylate transporter substrate binding protein [Bordetella bronchiseptica]OZI80388
MTSRDGARRSQAVSTRRLQGEISLVRRRVARACLLATAGLLAWPGAQAAGQAAAYPAKPVTIIVPYGAGSSTDILTRVLAKHVSAQLGQPVIVENKAGAGGAVGSAQVAHAAPDGYQLVMGTISSHSINQSMMKNLPYDVLRDFAPISLVAYFPNLLAVNRDLPVSNLADVVKLAKQRGGLNFATGGIGSSGQMGGELLKLRTGAPLNHVPYKEVGQAVADTVAGHVPLLFYQVPALVSQIQSGQLKAVAVLAPERTPLLPDVPTSTEQGITDFDATAWMGLFAPAGTPAPVVQRLNAAVAAAARDPALQKQLAPQGFTMVGNSPEEFRAFVRKDIDKWAEVVKATGASIQ